MWSLTQHAGPLWPQISFLSRFRSRMLCLCATWTPNGYLCFSGDRYKACLLYGSNSEDAHLAGHTGRFALWHDLFNLKTLAECCILIFELSVLDSCKLPPHIFFLLKSFIDKYIENFLHLCQCTEIHVQSIEPHCLISFHFRGENKNKNHDFGNLCSWPLVCFDPIVQCVFVSLANDWLHVCANYTRAVSTVHSIRSCRCGPDKCVWSETEVLKGCLQPVVVHTPCLWYCSLSHSFSLLLLPSLHYLSTYLLASKHLLIKGLLSCQQQPHRHSMLQRLRAASSSLFFFAASQMAVETS